jgi:serine/threonine-protein kinase
MLDAASPPIISVALAALISGTEGRLHPEHFIMLGLTHTLVARSALVPSTPRRSVAIGAMASLPLVAITYANHVRNPDPILPSPAGLAANVLMWCGFAVGASAIVSAVIYGLRQEVRKAQQLGQYTLEERIGEGGMGVVFRARHAMLRRPTAIKLLLQGRAAEADLRRFEREVQATSRLTHPNTVAIFDYGRTSDGIFYYAMEYIEGIDLEGLVDVAGPQPPGRVISILKQMCGALGEAHRAGLIHRDIKPANVLLCERGGAYDVVKVVDFGLVKSANAGVDMSVTNVDVMLGTPHYMAPEAISTPGDVDARSDLYAVGAVGYFLLTGATVFSGRTVVEVCSHHLLTRPIPPSERLGRSTSAALEAVILSCLEKEPSHRPQSAEALGRALDACDDAPPWREADARAFWEEHGELMRRHQAERTTQVPPSLGGSATVEVDARKRSVA